MSTEELIVSLWKGKGQRDPLCSGLRLTAKHILTVRHAFKEWSVDQPVYVRLIDGVDGDVEARVGPLHEERDAAIVELCSPEAMAGGPRLQGSDARDLKGKPAVAQVVDPDSFRRCSLTSTYSIGGLDHGSGEYIISPENAKGHSGGILEVDGEVVGLLSRRKPGEPLCRAVPIHLLWSWIQSSIGSPPQGLPGASEAGPTMPSRVSPAYHELVDRVRRRVRERLEDPALSALTTAWGSQDPLASFDFGDPGTSLSQHLTALIQATKSCLPDLQSGADAKQTEVRRQGCRFLLSELVRLAVDPGDSDSAGPVYLTCLFSGTADIYYCALGDLPHELGRRGHEPDVGSNVAVHLDDLLPSGVGGNLEQEVLRRLWLLTKMASDRNRDIPPRIEGANLALLKARIERHAKDRRRYFISTPGQRDWCSNSKPKALADRYRLGLVLRGQGDCTDLLLDEAHLIDPVLEYLDLLEDL